MIQQTITNVHCKSIPDSKVHGANMRPTRVLSAPGGLHVGPINLAIMDISMYTQQLQMLVYQIAILGCQIGNDFQTFIFRHNAICDTCL